MDRTLLDVSSLTVRHPGSTSPAVDSVSFTIAPGEILSVLGESGSGKTTLLRAIAGLGPPVIGQVTLDGVDITGLTPRSRGVAMMFQDLALFPHLDVAENVGYGLRMQGIARSERRVMVKELLGLVRLEGFEGREISTLSGGQRQRVALARALATDPKLLLLDEPLSSLDRSLRQGLIADLGDIFRSRSLAVIHVTHDQDEAFSFADSVMIMRAGGIIQRGGPRDLWNHPASEFVARFVGHPNVFTPDELVGVVDVDPEYEAVVLLLDAIDLQRPRHSSPPDAVVVAITPVAGWTRVHCRLSATGALVTAAIDDRSSAGFLVGDPVMIEIDDRGVLRLPG